MKTSTVILASAAAIAAGLVLLPRKARAAATQASGPRVAAGDASTTWGQYAYREQLSRELASSPDFWI